jgi:putative ABC transport system ATP-binding protein
MTALLRLESVAKTYTRGPRDLRVLQDITLAVEPGEFVGVYGARGTGKTTLLRIAAGFAAPDAGRVSFAGEDLAHVSRRRRAQLHHGEIGWVERAGPRSSELTIDVYVALPLYRRLGPVAARGKALRALARVGAEDAADACWENLSDATRTLVAFAHGLVREPRLLIVDDPTSGLDVIDRERVTGLLRAAAEEGGIAILMAAPELAAVQHADRALLLSRGRLLAPAERRPGATVVEFPSDKRRA